MKEKFYLLWFVSVIFFSFVSSAIGADEGPIELITAGEAATPDLPPSEWHVEVGREEDAWPVIELVTPQFVATTAAESYVDVKERYPSDAYIIGIAEVQSSGDVYKDRRRSEVLARLEIAKQIRVVIKEKTIDIMCEGGGKVLFDNQTECQNQIITVVEESVEEVLEGSRIVDTGEDKVKGIYYAVVVLPRKEAASKAEEGYKESIEIVRQYLNRARVSEDEETRKEQAKKAKEELIKSMAYVGERSAIDKTRHITEDMFKELAEEIIKIEGEER